MATLSNNADLVLAATRPARQAVEKCFPNNDQLLEICHKLHQEIIAVTTLLKPEVAQASGPFDNLASAKESLSLAANKLKKDYADFYPRLCVSDISQESQKALTEYVGVLQDRVSQVANVEQLQAKLNQSFEVTCERLVSTRSGVTSKSRIADLERFTKAIVNFTESDAWDFSTSKNLERKFEAFEKRFKSYKGDLKYQEISNKFSDFIFLSKSIDQLFHLKNKINFTTLYILTSSLDLSVYQDQLKRIHDQNPLGKAAVSAKRADNQPARNLNIVEPSKAEIKRINGGKTNLLSDVKRLAEEAKTRFKQADKPKQKLLELVKFVTGEMKKAVKKLRETKPIDYSQNIVRQLKTETSSDVFISTRFVLLKEQAKKAFTTMPVRDAYALVNGKLHEVNSHLRSLAQRGVFSETEKEALAKLEERIKPSNTKQTADHDLTFELVVRSGEKTSLPISSKMQLIDFEILANDSRLKPEVVYNKLTQKYTLEIAQDFEGVVNLKFYLKSLDQPRPKDLAVWQTFAKYLTNGYQTESSELVASTKEAELQTNKTAIVYSKDPIVGKFYATLLDRGFLEEALSVATVGDCKILNLQKVVNLTNRAVPVLYIAGPALLPDGTCQVKPGHAQYLTVMSQGDVTSASQGSATNLEPSGFYLMLEEARSCQKSEVSKLVSDFCSLVKSRELVESVGGDGGHSYRQQIDRDQKIEQLYSLLSSSIELINSKDPSVLDTEKQLTYRQSIKYYFSIIGGLDYSTKDEFVIAEKLHISFKDYINQLDPRSLSICSLIDVDLSRYPDICTQALAEIKLLEFERISQDSSLSDISIDSMDIADLNLGFSGNIDLLCSVVSRIQQAEQLDCKIISTLCKHFDSIEKMLLIGELPRISNREELIIAKDNLAQVIKGFIDNASLVEFYEIVKALEKGSLSCAKAGLFAKYISADLKSTAELDTSIKDSFVFGQVRFDLGLNVISTFHKWLGGGVFDDSFQEVIATHAFKIEQSTGPLGLIGPTPASLEGQFVTRMNFLTRTSGAYGFVGELVGSCGFKLSIVDKAWRQVRSSEDENFDEENFYLTHFDILKKQEGQDSVKIPWEQIDIGILQEKDFKHEGIDPSLFQSYKLFKIFFNTEIDTFAYASKVSDYVDRVEKECGANSAYLGWAIASKSYLVNSLHNPDVFYDMLSKATESFLTEEQKQYLNANVSYFERYAANYASRNNVTYRTFSTQMREEARSLLLKVGQGLDESDLRATWLSGSGLEKFAIMVQFLILSKIAGSQVLYNSYLVNSEQAHSSLHESLLRSYLPKDPPHKVSQADVDNVITETFKLLENPRLQIAQVAKHGAAHMQRQERLKRSIEASRSGTEIREYQQGDSYQAIDWNTTARLGKLYVKNGKEISNKATVKKIWLDLNLTSNSFSFTWDFTNEHKFNQIINMLSQIITQVRKSGLLEVTLYWNSLEYRKHKLRKDNKQDLVELVRSLCDYALELRSKEDWVKNIDLGLPAEIRAKAKLALSGGASRNYPKENLLLRQFYIPKRGEYLEF